jgi:hypothetical protein
MVRARDGLLLKGIERPVQAKANVAAVQIIASVTVKIVVIGERVSGVGGKAKSRSVRRASPRIASAEVHAISGVIAGMSGDMTAMCVVQGVCVNRRYEHCQS